MKIDTIWEYTVTKSKKRTGNCIYCGDPLDGNSLRIHYERGRYDFRPSYDYLHAGCRDAMETCEAELSKIGGAAEAEAQAWEG